jgi:hypothetical protein
MGDTFALIFFNILLDKLLRVWYNGNYAARARPGADAWGWVLGSDEGLASNGQ